VGDEVAIEVRRHQVALALAARLPDRFGAADQVPLTLPEPTAAVDVHADAADTGQPTTATDAARSAELPELRLPRVEYVAATVPEFVKVQGAVSDRVDPE
jgi:hypothetical protein